MKNIEVEFKVKLDNEADFLSKIEKLGAVYLKETRQVDKYFSHPLKDFKTLVPPEFIRVREQGNRVKFGYHLALSHGGAQEHETWCDCPEELYNILDNMGCKLLGTIDKQRKYYELYYGGQKINIVFDDVKNLGKFAEAEIMIDDKNKMNETELFLRKFLTSLGYSDFNVPRFSFLAVGRKWE